MPYLAMHTTVQELSVAFYFLYYCVYMTGHWRKGVLLISDCTRQGDSMSGDVLTWTHSMLDKLQQLKDVNIPFIQHELAGLQTVILKRYT